MIPIWNHIPDRILPERLSFLLASLAVAVVIIAGCGGEDHGHEHPGEAGAIAADEHAAELLLHGDGIEWFIEYGPMVAGEQSQWRIHLTRVDAGRPVTEGDVALRFAFGRGTEAEIAARRVRDGIWLATVDVPEPGYARVQAVLAAGDIRDTVTAEELPVYASREALHAVAGKEPEDGIVFTREEAWSMDFRVAPVERRRFPSIIKTTGHLLSSPSMEAEVPATASGILSYAADPLLPGQRVTRNEVLAVIEGGALSAENLAARIADAEAVLAKARADHERAEKLYAEQVVSQKYLQETTLRLRQAETMLRTLKADVEDGGKGLRSPLSGYVKRVRVPNGAYVDEGTAILTVARNDRMLLKAELYQSDYAQLSSIHGASFRTDDGRTFDIRDLNGKLVSRGRAVDATAYSIPVFFEIDGGSLLPGEFVDVYLHAGEEDPRLVIPVSALTEDLGTFSVYVQRGGERYEKRQVEIGTGDGSHVPVLSGLAEGERVVTRGMHAVRLAASAGQVQAHGHAH